MNKYHGGEKVARGVYINLSMLEFVQMYQPAPILPGDAEVKYLKVPAPLTVIAGPLAGLVFILFLPFIGVVGMISFIIYKAWQGMLAMGQLVLRPTAAGWKPGIAYLTRRGGRPKATRRAPEADSELARMAQEVDEQRQQQKM